jgi:hypothetical protein
LAFCKCGDFNFGGSHIGMYHVAEIQDAHILAPFLGTKWAPILFAIALICGAKFNITGTGWTNYHGGLLKFKNQPGCVES